MSARRATPRSGSPILADVSRDRDSVVHQLRHRTWVPGQPAEEPRPQQRRTEPPSRRSGSIAGELRESFFDLAQRYHKLRESAFKPSKKASVPPPPAPAARERRLTDLPPAPADDGASLSAFLDSN